MCPRLNSKIELCDAYSSCVYCFYIACNNIIVSYHIQIMHVDINDNDMNYEYIHAHTYIQCGYV